MNTPEQMAFGTRSLRSEPARAGWRCGVLAPRDRWADVYRSGNIRVLCNRAPDHVGPHRYTEPRTFAVLAEWAALEAER